MNLDEILALRYVQRELDEQALSDFEKRLVSEPALAKTVDQIKASQLPYETALDTGMFAPVPEHIKQLIETELHPGQTSDTSPGAPADFSAKDAQSTSPSRIGSLMRYAALVALSFAAGYWFSTNEWADAQVPQTVLVDSTSYERVSASETESGLPHNALSYMAAYQALYARDTIANVQQSPSEAQALLVQQSTVFDHDLSLADLSQLDYVFKRAQVLRYSGKPIVQMVYQAADGMPVAICAFKRENLPADLVLNQVLQIAGMDLVARAKDDVIFVLMAPQDLSAKESLIDYFKQLG